MLANRVSMGPGLPADRFLWVAYADALMYPLVNHSMIHNSDQKAFFALEEKLLSRYYTESGVPSRPAVLDDYLNKVVRATLERHKQGGAVAEKFEMAYLRPFDIGNPTKAEAEAAWAGRASDKDLSYKALQDYIFRFIAAECGRLGMAVHFHTNAGAGSYFNVSGGNPMLLEPLLNNPSLRKTNFVFLHGGWPFEHQLTALLAKPNLYVDFSSQNSANYPAELARTIRAWLEFVPEKVLFATDAYPYSADAGWEETGYIAAETSREALAIALTGMLRDGEVTRARASELARMVLRDNARALYKLK
jgi:predicted TIM-barrel fold metal-dependent hydrolase